MASIYKLIATINPERYFTGSAKDKAEFKKLIQTSGFSKASEKAKPTCDQEYKIVYDSSSETLEPVYFWILDFMNTLYKEVDKVVDNFTATPGSEDFLHSMDKAKRMQDSAMNIYGTVNTVIKSVLNIIYDLKEFQLRLKDYENANSEDQGVRNAGMITLKQIWMDQVDIKKGRGSLNMLSQDLNFVTIRDAFMASNSIKDVNNLDLNDRVKRILAARIQEFLEWKDRSEAELKKRFEIEKTYLKTQVDAIKMYSKWARPYLKAASELMISEQKKYKPELVKAFNTTYFELTLLAKNKIDVYNSAVNKDLPPAFANMKMKRDYYSCAVVEFTFRGIPSRVGQNVAFGGRVEVSIKSYGLNQEELDLLYYEMDKSDLSDMLKFVEGMTGDSLEQLKVDIEEFLGEEKRKEKAKKALKEADINPFTALVGMGGKFKPEEVSDDEVDKKSKSDSELEAKMKKLEKGIKKDSYVEKTIREHAIFGAKKTIFTVYDIYKKAHGMGSVPFDKQLIKPDLKVSFTDVFKG